MMNCKTCKHWRRGGALVHEDYSFLKPPFEPVGRDGDGKTVVCMTDENYKIGLCLNPSISCDYVADWLNYPVQVEATSDGLIAQDDESRTVLRTGEDFGCIHHEPK